MRPRLPLMLGVAILLLFEGVMFAHGGVPALGDYGEWIYHGALLRDVLAGRPDAGYVLKLYPVPNSLTTVGLGVLMLVVPWAVAAKLWLGFAMALGLGCGYALNRASVQADGSMLWVLPGAVLCGLDFWWGFSNFLLGVSLTMLLAAYLLRGARRQGMVGGLLVLVFFSHMIPFGFGCLLLAAYAWQTRRWRLLWQMVPGLALTAWYVVARYSLEGNADGQAGMESSTRYLSGSFAAFKVNSYLKIWGLVNPALGTQDSVAVRRLGEGTFAGLAALDVGVALLLGWLLWVSGRRSFRERTRDRFLWAAVGIFFLLFAAMPGAALGISDPGGRMIQAAIWVAVMAAATTRRWQGPALAVASLALMVANAVLFATVAFGVPMVGTTMGWMPQRLRAFAHVYYADRWTYPGSVERREMDRSIYPTALFLRR